MSPSSAFANYVIKQTPAFAAALQIDWSLGDMCAPGVLTANFTPSFVNASRGQMCSLLLQQDATGGRTVTLPSSVVGSVPPMPLAPNASIAYQFRFDGLNYWAVNQDTHTHGCRVHNAAGQTFTVGTDNVLVWDTNDWDADGWHSTTTNNTRLTVPTGLAGKVLLIAGIFTNVGGAGQVDLKWRKNGTTIVGQTRMSVASTDSSPIMVCIAEDTCVATDYYELLDNPASFTTANLTTGYGLSWATVSWQGA